MQSRILVVEDNEIEQSALTAAFEHDGYLVDSVSDGIAAVRKLRSGQYDLALFDYHIPKVDGLASARILHEIMDEETLPKLVAITAKSAELKERQGQDGPFDVIVSKPYDLKDVLKIVGAQLKSAGSSAQSAAADDVWRSVGLEKRPAAVLAAGQSAAEEKVLWHLFNLRRDCDPDVIVLAGSDAASRVVSLREDTDLFRCPVIDATGEFREVADATLTDFSQESLHEVAAVIEKFRSRFGRLAPRFQLAECIDDRLLAYLFLSGRSLHPERCAKSKSFVRYTGFFSSRVVFEVAERLRGRGLLERTFFDRVHVCSSCSSARNNAREECPACRSANLRTEPLIHHFRCGWQAPESEFRHGRELVCPKCRQALRHYGSDYDKPGNVSVCADCSDIFADPSVGFVCFDCGAHVDGDAAEHRDIFSYRLTEAALELLTLRPSIPEQRPAGAGASAVVKGKLAGLVADHETATVVEIAYPTADEIIAKVGARGFNTLRGIFLHNLLAALPKDVDTHAEDRRDFLLSHGPLEDIGDELLDHCQENLAERLDPTVRVISLRNREPVDEHATICH